ncbi:MAG: 1,4-dihydroxy-2-naphthoate polyprenyltransferase [Bradymonadia bacterium]
MSTHASPMPADRPSTFKVWLLAIRPATLVAGVTPVVVGTALAAAVGRMHLLAALAALLGALLIQIGTNLFNDYQDFARGADTEDRMGPARATQRGWLTARQVLQGTLVAFAAAVLVGCYLVWHGGWPVVAIGVVSVLSGLAYTGGPMPLAYHGLGDLFVVVFFGGVAVCGTYYVQAFELSTGVVLASLAVGLMANAILVVNNLRDRPTDIEANKRTLVVRFGDRFGRFEYAAMVFGAYGLLVAAWALGHGGAGWLLPLASLPLGALLVKVVWGLEGKALNPHLGTSGRLGLLFGVLLSVGVML